MKKIAIVISCLAIAALAGPAFAQPAPADSALEAVIAGTDPQFASVMNGALEQYQAVTLPAPSMARVAAHSVKLQDITEKSTYQGEVVSAYPLIYKMVHSEENSRIIKVFRYLDPKGGERRIEVYYTGGDWMQYGLTYIVTNAGRNKDRVNAYLVSDLSTPDREEGGIAPRVNPFDPIKLGGFISADFLDAAGNVRVVFSSIAAISASAR